MRIALLDIEDGIGEVSLREYNLLLAVFCDASPISRASKKGNRIERALIVFGHITQLRQAKRMKIGLHALYRKGPAYDRDFLD
jgi:hypothetical protein